MAESTATAGSRPLATPWFAFLAGPVVGALHEAIGYLLVARGCATGFPAFTVGGLTGLQLLEAALGVVAEAVLIAAIVNGLHVWRSIESRAGEEGVTAGRVRFMALVGMIMSAGFALYVLYATVAALVLNPCVFL
jgi:hypothetical protein